MKLRLRKLKGYKYCTQGQYVRDFVAGAFEIQHKFICISDGNILIEEHYAYDGASGPTFDGKTNLKAALVHDAAYQLMREGLLGRWYRKQVDELFRKHCIEDGMGKFRAWYYYKAVRIFGARTSLPEKNPRGQIITI